MRDYVITVNSTVDLPKEWLEERKVPVIPLKYTIDNETYTDMEGLSSKEFFGKLRDGKMATTSQINPEEASTVGTIFKRGKRCAASWILIRFKRNVQQYADRRRRIKRGISGSKDHHHRYALRMPWRGTAAL